MRVLIYGEGAEALAILEKERAEGHHASLRTPEFPDEQPEECDRIHAWASNVWHAYEGKAEIVYHGHLVTEEEAEAYDAEPQTEQPKPKRKKK